MIQDPDVMNTQSCDLNNGKKNTQPETKKAPLFLSLLCVCACMRAHTQSIYRNLFKVIYNL